MATSLLQLNSAPAMRGRVISLLVVAIAGTTPIGGPLIGWVGELWSARVAFVIGGVSTALAVLGTRLYLARRPALESGSGEAGAPSGGKLDQDLIARPGSRPSDCTASAAPVRQSSACA